MYSSLCVGSGWTECTRAFTCCKLVPRPNWVRWEIAASCALRNADAAEAMSEGSHTKTYNGRCRSPDLTLRALFHERLVLRPQPLHAALGLGEVALKPAKLLLQKGALGRNVLLL